MKDWLGNQSFIQMNPNAKNLKNVMFELIYYYLNNAPDFHVLW